jgi:DNA adenine methylase
MQHEVQLRFDFDIESENLHSVLLEEMKSAKRNNRLLAIRWYGGKFSHLDWLLPLLPSCQHFCEPFGGSAAVLLNREPSPVETYNDIDGDLVTFFRVLRDKPDELIEKLAFTPFSREEFRKAYEMRGRTDIPEVERARLFFVRAEQVRIGLAQTSTAGRWAWCKLTSRRGMSGAVSRWLNKIDALWAVSERLRRVQIENRDAIEVILQYDSPETLFYLDPPYPHESRGDAHAYAYEMTERDHERLAEVLHSIRGKAAISGYRSPLTERLYGDWTRIDAPPAIIHSVKEPRIESVWINYNITEIGRDIIGRLEQIGVSFHVKP